MADSRVRQSIINDQLDKKAELIKVYFENLEEVLKSYTTICDGPDNGTGYAPYDCRDFSRDLAKIVDTFTDDRNEYLK